MSEIPEDCMYTKDHEWVRKEGDDVVKIGITDYAQSSLGDIVFVELPEVGTGMEITEPFGTLDAVKTATELFSPITGEVVEINETLQDDPSLVNQSPYGDGWMVQARVNDPAALEELMSPEAYEKFVEGIEGEA